MNPYYNLSLEELKEAFDTQNQIANTARRDLVACDNPTFAKYIRAALDEADRKCEQISDAFYDRAVEKHCK